jgi:putative YhbY family RNA-binding protein
MVGEAGLTSAVLREIDLALKSHELIKVRVLGEDRRRRAEMIAQACQALQASPVQLVGRMLVLFRPRPPQPEPDRPRAQPRKKRGAPRRTKRSYQM